MTREPTADRVHQHVAGWGGEPGECGVECACGVTYDGFDSIGEALALLKLHIANGEPRPRRVRRFLTSLGSFLRRVAFRRAGSSQREEQDEKPRHNRWTDFLTVLFGMVLGAVVIFGAAYLLGVPLAEGMFR